jgi:hypothetical protein
MAQPAMYHFGAVQQYGRPDALNQGQDDARHRYSVRRIQDMRSITIEEDICRMSEATPNGVSLSIATLGLGLIRVDSG